MKNRVITRLPLVIAAAIVFAVQWPLLHAIPDGIHAWAQFDRFALSLGFLENGFNLFKPQTFVYNHQFPSDWIRASSSAITAVDFAFHEWLVALFMNLTGFHSIILFKLYVFAWSLTGLYFWWKTALTITESYFKSGVALLFATASPVFLFYSGSTLPGIPSLASAMAGLYFFVLFKKHQRAAYFNISLVWLTLAALTRTTFVIPLFGVFLLQWKEEYKKPSVLKKRIPGVLLSLSVLAGYFFYNRWLAANYGSMFLNELMPAKSRAQAIDCLQVMFENWKFEWLTLWHYFLLAFVLVLSVIKFRESINRPDNHLFDSLKVWTLICLMGCLMFFIAMLRQFPQHDYYFLDTFFLPLCMIFLLGLHQISFDGRKPWIHAGMILLSIMMVLSSIRVIQHRHHNAASEHFRQMIENFSGADKWLHQTGVADHAKILVVDVPAPNPPFIFMKRKGYVILSSNMQSPDHIEAALKFPLDYVVIESHRQEMISQQIPQLHQQFQVVSSNNKLILLRRKPEY
jgi:hypothetical protein